jgi:hypothetical protein
VTADAIATTIIDPSSGSQISPGKTRSWISPAA